MKYNNESLITCPHCGYKDQDSWEYNDQEEEFEINCGRCDLPMVVEKHTTVTYSTIKQPCEDGKHNYVTKSAHCKNRQFIGSGLSHWVDLPKEKWEYFLVQECTICERDTYPKITLEEYEDFNLNTANK